MSDNVSSLQIDYNTGEILQQWNYGDSIKTIRKETKDYLNSTEEINKEKMFTKTYNIPIRMIVDLHLTPTAYEILFIMISYLGWGQYSGLIIKLKNRCFNGCMNGKELKEIVGCKDTAFKSAIKQLEDKGIIKVIPSISGKGNNFILNPYIATHDKRIPIELLKINKKTPFNYRNNFSHNISSDIFEKIKSKETKTKR